MSELLYPPTQEELMAVFRQKYSKNPTLGWGPRMRLESGYFTPDDHYEALVGRLLTPGGDWCDVGCGRNMFPENPELARRYAERCNFVYGIDPDNNIRENRFVHQYFQGLVEDCPTDRRFDLVTLRMVAEHIEHPDPAMSRIASLLKPSGIAIIYTPYKWAPMSLAATVTPFGLHNPLKRLLWDSEARDTFPTQYKLNTRSDIHQHALRAGMSIVYFERLDDCRITNSYRWLNRLELHARRALRELRLPYPEACLLAALQLKQVDSSGI